MLCSMPGGITDSSLIAKDMDGYSQGARNAVCRLVFGIGVLPSIIVFFNKLFVKTKKNEKTQQVKEFDFEETQSSAKP
jgi:uncharacterized membrane protein AbrB (regulator of aidB expression)